MWLDCFCFQVKPEVNQASESNLKSSFSRLTRVQVSSDEITATLADLKSTKLLSFGMKQWFKCLHLLHINYFFSETRPNKQKKKPLIINNTGFAVISGFSLPSSVTCCASCSSKLRQWGDVSFMTGAEVSDNSTLHWITQSLTSPHCLLGWQWREKHWGPSPALIWCHNQDNKPNSTHTADLSNVSNEKDMFCDRKAQ